MVEVWTMFNEARLALAAFRIYRDPDRLDEVLEAAPRLAKKEDLDRLATSICEASPAFAAALAERRIMKLDLAELAARPGGSLGRAVFDHCTRWKIDPRTFPRRPNTTAGDYVIVHIENTHDVWHAVTGFDSDMIGEIGLQAFYLAQFPNLLGLMLLGLANLRVLRYEPTSYPRLMDEITRGWLGGKRAKPLLGVRWDDWWDRPLAEVQRELGIDAAASC
jgi:ubiquinone biosynthesis protein Coq4